VGGLDLWGRGAGTNRGLLGGPKTNVSEVFEIAQDHRELGIINGRASSICSASGNQENTFLRRI